MALFQEQAKFEVTLTTKDMNEVVRKSISTMSAKEITEHCQRAINNTHTPDLNNSQIQDINKLTNDI